MKIHLQELARQPHSIINLAHQLTRCIHEGRDSIHVLNLTAEEAAWLIRHGFDFTYDRRIHEYKITLD